MNLSKPRVDIGLNTNNLDAMLEFWHGEVGLPFDHVLPIRRGVKQHRLDANGSVLKINHHEAPLPDRPPSGYDRLLIVRNDISKEKRLTDPDGNDVRLIPRFNSDGLAQIGIHLSVRDLAAHVKFYKEAFGMEFAREFTTDAGLQIGETAFWLDQSKNAPSDAGIEGKGFRYITFQVFKCDEEHARVLAHGGREAMAPTTLGTTARISMVRDPDGNWIEISQRASITGSLE